MGNLNRLQRLLRLGAIIGTIGLAKLAIAQTTTGYAYDSVGNRTAVANQIHFTDAAVYSFAPPLAIYGQRVNIFGRNLPPGDGAGITVTFGGVPAPILAVAPNVITMQVPPGATSGAVVVTLPDAAPVELGDVQVSGVVLTPGSGFYLFSHPTQFLAEVVGQADQSVTWELLAPPPMGDPPLATNPGTLDDNGLYTPPGASVLNPAPVVVVKVTSVASPGLSAVAVLQLLGIGTHQPPASVVVPGPGDPDDFPLNVVVGPTAVSALALGPGPVNGYPLNTVVAFPPITTLVPGPDGPNGLAPSVFVAYPPAAVLLLGEGDVNGLTLGTTIAQPPVDVCGPPCGPPEDPCQPIECPD